MEIITDPEVYEYHKNDIDCDLFVLAEGFEDRAYHFLLNNNFSKEAYCIAFNYKNSVVQNEVIHKKYKNKITQKFSNNRIYSVMIDSDDPRDLDKTLHDKLEKIPGFQGKVWFDISGFPSYAICMVLRLLRLSYPTLVFNIIYTAAKEYSPSKAQYKKLLNKQREGVDFLPSSMAVDMNEIFIPESFSGHRTRDGSNCLVVFAGYDSPRSSGVINDMNPSMLLLLYGLPGDERFYWRHDLSKQLHKRFETTRNTATEDVSTLNPKEALDRIEEYYEYLFDDYDVTVSPVCSKMQSVAAYLFWERYNEVQLVFPLPIGYDYDRRPKGVAKTYCFSVSPRALLFRNRDNDQVNSV